MAVDWTGLAGALGMNTRAAADADALRGAPAALGHPLSEALQDLYGQTDGVLGEDGSVPVMTLAELIHENGEMRRLFSDLYMPFDHLLVFGQLGNGDLFMHPVLAGAVQEDVFHWDHEDDSRTWYAFDVEATLRRFAVEG